jgi:hypothetical protein
MVEQRQHLPQRQLCVQLLPAEPQTRPTRR